MKAVSSFEKSASIYHSAPRDVVNIRTIRTSNLAGEILVKHGWS